MQAQEITPEFFIKPGADLQRNSPDYTVMGQILPERLQKRWDTSYGQHILARWQAGGYQRTTLDDLVGRFYGHTDLRGVNLSKVNLTGMDLSQVDFFKANLENAKFENADLSNSYLSEANIRGTCFDWAKMDDVLIDNVDFNNETSFIGVKLPRIDFNLSELLQDYAYSQQRIVALKRRYPRLAAILWATCDYGRSFPRLLAWCGGIILVFGAAYFALPGTLSKPGLWESLYFSLVTFTGLGSDIQPLSNIGRALVSVQSILSYLASGLLIAILVKRTIGD